MKTERKPYLFRLIYRSIKNAPVRTEKKGKTFMEKMIRAAKAGEPDAFTRLMKSQMQSMYKTAGAILMNDEDIADAVSDTILTCWESIGCLREEKYFRTWMTRILINKCNDIIRRKKYILQADIPDKPYIDSGFENTEWKETINMVSDKYRLVLVLYYIEDFNTKDISEMLGMPEGAVRSRLARGREQLRQIYEEREYETGGQAL